MIISNSGIHLCLTSIRHQKVHHKLKIYLGCYWWPQFLIFFTQYFLVILNFCLLFKYFILNLFTSAFIYLRAHFRTDLYFPGLKKFSILAARIFTRSKDVTRLKGLSNIIIYCIIYTILQVQII